MARKRFSDEDVIRLLRQIEVELASGATVATACRSAGVSDATYYGYRKIAALLRMKGWEVNDKKVERLWGEEGLQLPKRHKKRQRLYHKDSSVIRLRPMHPNHI